MSKDSSQLIKGMKAPAFVKYFSVLSIITLLALLSHKLSDVSFVPSGDQGLQIAWMQWHQNPELYPGDSITVAFRDYHSLLLRFMSPYFSPTVSLKLLSQSHYISLLLFFGMLALLGYGIFGRWTESFWAGYAICIIPLPALAGSPLLNSNFVPSSVAVPLIIAALLCYLQSRWIIMGGLLGVTTLLHPLEGGASFAALFAAAMISTRGKQIKSLGVAMAAYAVISLPIIFIMLSAGVAGSGGNDWIEILKMRSPHHIFPFSWSIGTMVKFVLFCGVGFAGLLHWHKYSERPNKDLILHRVIALGGAVALLAIPGILFTEIWPISLVVKSQPMRSANLLVMLAIPFWGYLAFMLLLISISQIFKLGQNADKRFIKEFGDLYSNTSGSFSIMVGFMVLSIAFSNIAIDDKHVEKKFFSNYREAQTWARENSRPEQRFLCLPPLENFRTLSQRPEFGSWKDGTLANFSPEYAVEWRRRMELLGMTWTPEFKGYRGAAALARIWERPTAEQVRRVLSAEPCDFIVTQFGAQLPDSTDWKPVFRNTSVIIYEVQPSDEIIAPAHP